MAKKSRADRKKEIEKQVNTTDKKQKESNDIKSADKKEAPKKQYTYEPQEAPKLTFYTTFSMLSVLVAAISTAMAMCMLAKPVGYIMDAYYGGYEDTLYINMFKNDIFSKATQENMAKMFAVIAVLVVVATVLSIIDVVKVSNPKNKPLLLVSIVAFCVSAVALGLYIYEAVFINGQFEIYYVEYDPMFNIYKWLMIALICNAVFMLLNVIGNAIGFSKWKKTRQAY